LKKEPKNFCESGLALGSERNRRLPGSAQPDSRHLSGRKEQVASEFWLSDDQWAVIEPLVPTHRRRVATRYD
jgi:hypothetical protein